MSWFKKFFRGKSKQPEENVAQQHSEPVSSGTNKDFAQPQSISKKNDDTVLIVALKEDKTGIAQTLIENGADINEINKYGNTALIEASRRNNIKIVKMLIDKGVDINATNKTRGSAIGVATIKGHTEIIKMLIAKGAEVNATNKSGKAALNVASEKNHNAMENINIEFEKAIYKGNSEGAKNAINKGADVNTVSYSYLPSVNDDSDIKLLSFLVDAGVSDKWKNEALCSAAWYGQCKQIEFLLSVADPNYYNGQQTPLHKVAVGYAFDEKLKDPQSAPMRYAQVTELLCHAGANLNAISKRGDSPLHYAIENNAKSIVTVLLKHGAEVNIHRTGDLMTPLHQAAENGNTDIIQLLLDYEANVNAKRAGDRTPLYEAVAYNHVEAVELLISQGASRHITTDQGKTPLDTALWNINNSFWDDKDANAEIVKILERAS